MPCLKSPRDLTALDEDNLLQSPGEIFQLLPNFFIYTKGDPVHRGKEHATYEAQVMAWSHSTSAQGTHVSIHAADL